MTGAPPLSSFVRLDKSSVRLSALPDVVVAERYTTVTMTHLQSLGGLQLLALPLRCVHFLTYRDL